MINLFNQKINKLENTEHILRLNRVPLVDIKFYRYVVVFDNWEEMGLFNHLQVWWFRCCVWTIIYKTTNEGKNRSNDFSKK